MLVLTAHFTTNVVQLRYTIDLQKKQKEECKGKIDIDKVIAFMNKIFQRLLKKILIYMS